jgi:hypothetical protein
VKEEVPGSSPVGGDRRCIMSLAMRVDRLEVVETKILLFNFKLNTKIMSLIFIFLDIIK